MGWRHQHRTTPPLTPTKPHPKHLQHPRKTAPHPHNTQQPNPTKQHPTLRRTKPPYTLEIRPLPKVRIRQRRLHIHTPHPARYPPPNNTLHRSTSIVAVSGSAAARSRADGRMSWSIRFGALTSCHYMLALECSEKRSELAA